MSRPGTSARSAPLPTRLRSALLLLLAALTALASVVAPPTRAQAAPQETAQLVPYWQTVGYRNLAVTHGMRYVSQADPRWGKRYMESLTEKTYEKCACIISAMASLLNYEFPLPGDTIPHFRSPVDTGNPAEPYDSQYLWSPVYLDRLFMDEDLYEGLGTCGTLPYPWAAAEAGAPKQWVDGDGQILASAPSGVLLTRHDIAWSDAAGRRWPTGAFSSMKDVVAAELVAGRPVMMGRKTPVGGFHVYLIVGFDPLDGQYLSYNVGWQPGRKPTTALMYSWDESYEEWEDSITDLWLYERVEGTPPYLDWSSLGASGLRSAGAPAETFELALTTPDGRRIGYDPATGRRLVSEGSYSGGRFDQADAITGESVPAADAAARHLFVRNPATGRYFAEVIATHGAGTLATEFRDETGQHLGDLAVDVPDDGTVKVEVDRAADGSVTTTPVGQFGPQPVLAGPSQAKAGDELEFDALGSFDADGTVESYAWDLGDGTTVEGERIVTHAFDAPGTYDVELTVTDDAGASRTETHTVTVVRSDDMAPDVTFAPQGGAWQQQPFDVTVTGSDTGRGVRTTTFEATGATTVPSTTVDGDETGTVRITEEGRTTITARAVDRDGNDSPVRTVEVGVDTAPPSSAVTTPAPGGRTAGLGILAGTITDATSGAARVDVSLRRESDGRFWSGSAWGTTETWLPASLGSVTADRWYVSGGLPGGGDLPPGGYVVRSRAVDRAGNAEAAGGGAAFEVTGSVLPTATPVELDVPAGSPVAVESVDDDGTVVGRIGQDAVRWAPDGTRTTLPPLPGHLYGWARDVTAGVAVGESNGTGGVMSAVLWRDGEAVDLGLLAPGRRSAAYSVDASGTAVGLAYDDEGRERPVRFSADGPEVLPPLPGVTVLEGSARAISPDGRFVAGIAKDATGATVTVRWDGATPTVLTGAFAVPHSVNDDGVVVGTGTVSGLHAVMWDADGTLRDLGPGSGYDVDARGTVVGSAVALGGNAAGQAAWWQGGGRSLFDGTLPAGSPWRLITATAISDSTGIVVGSGRNGDRGGYWRMEVPAVLEDRDVTPPEVTAEPADAGWSADDVTVRVRATDTGSGVASVRTSTTGDVAGDAVEVPVTDEGETTVAYSATDRAGNTSAAATATVRIDRTAPEVSLRRLGPAAEWSTSEVPVVMAATDALSGVAELRYRVDDGPQQRVPGDRGGVSIGTDGVHTLTVVAVDEAGNESEPATTEVRVDRTAPAPRIDVATGGDGRPTGAVASATDAHSGVATVTLTHTVDGEQVPVEGLHTALGAAGTHTLAVHATDAAGNTATETVDVTVPQQPGLEAEPAGPPPIADAGGPYRAVVGRPVQLDGSRSTSASGGPLHFAWSVGGAGAAEGERPQVTWSQAGRYVVTLEVRDGDRWSRNEPGDRSRVEVEVVEPSASVEADAGDDRTAVEGTAVDLAGSVSEGASARWSAEPVSPGEGTCRFGDETAAATTVECDDEGSWRLTLTATSADGGASASDTVDLVVSNDAPTVVLEAPAQVVVGTAVTVRAAVGDRGPFDALSCRFTWPDATGTTVPVDAGSCSGNRVLDGVGDQQVQVTVVDGDGGSTTASGTVAVRYAVTLPEGGTVNPGRAIPIRFGLGGFHGYDVLVEAVSVRLDAADRPVGAEAPAWTPGVSDLSYATGTDRYSWNWDTAEDWRGQTRALILRFDDGSEHRVVHRFR